MSLIEADPVVPSVERGHGRTAAPDIAAATAAAARLLEALGVDCSSQSTAETPRRMAEAYAEMLTPREFEMTTFANDENYRGLVVVENIPVRSVCEHHLLAFTGVAHVGYLPRERILGLSKFARVVEMFAKRPQVQERLTQQIATWLQEQLRSCGVGVVIEAEHSCMTLRGALAEGTATRTTATTGQLQTDPALRREFLESIPGRKA